jgi:hypothetical protein
MLPNAERNLNRWRYIPATVDALLPLWFALVRQNGGNRKVALRIVR